MNPGLLRSANVDEREPLLLSRSRFSADSAAVQSADGARAATPAHADDAPDHNEATSGQQPFAYGSVDPYAGGLQRTVDQTETSHLALHDIEAARQRAREVAEQEGYRAGYDSGRAEALRETAEQRAKWSALLASTRSAFQKEIAGLEDLVVEIAFESTMKILGRAMAEHAGIVGIVKEVVARARDRADLVVRVAPGDLSVIHAHQEDLGFLGEGIVIRADERVSLGGCLLETAEGGLDGRLEIQLQQLRDALLAARSLRDQADV